MRDYAAEAEGINAQRRADAIRNLASNPVLLADAIDDYYNTDGNRAVSELAHLFIARVNGYTTLDGESVAEFEARLINRIIESYAKYTYNEVTANELEMLEEEIEGERRRDERIDLQMERAA